MEFLHMTATYSNALLVAIMPHVSDFAKKLELPIPQPVTAAMVRDFKPSPIKDHIGGGMMLTNGDWFSFNDGAVDGYRSPNDVFVDQDPAKNWPNYAYGKENMTTNDALALARASLTKLGYDPKELGCDIPPWQVNGPIDLNNGHHVPHYQMRWNRYSAPTNADEQHNNDYVTVEVDMQKKVVTGIAIVSRKIWRESPKVDVVPQTEREFKKNQFGPMFKRTNAPTRLTN
jgi:hypothetical protein